MNTEKPRSLTGIRPSGNLHIGNYLGMIRPALELQQKYQCLYFIADLHALTTNRNAADLQSQTLDLVAAWVTLGLDTDEHLIFRQSDVPMVAEYAWYLSCVTGVGFLEKAHAYKDAASQNREVNHGVFAYPVLMAADILMYDVDVVPVGKDQKQHVEMARDMAGSFNAAYGKDVIKLPEPVIREEVMVIPGLDGRKMSKSYGNEIGLFATEKALRKQIMSIKTDSTPLEEPKSMKDSLLEQLYGYFATEEQAADLEQRLNQGGLGWGHAKDELFQLINDHISESRVRYLELRADQDALDRILREGQERALDLALPILNRVRKTVGANPIELRVG